MSSFTDTIITALQTKLEDELITNVDEADVSRANVVKIGPLQGNPDLDEAPINIEIYTNDPDNPEEWLDETAEWEIGGGAIWIRRFTILYRTLLVDSGETLPEALAIVSGLRSRVENTLRTMSWAGVSAADEEADFVGGIEGELSQGGGPEAYDWVGRTRFEVITRSK